MAIDYSNYTSNAQYSLTANTTSVNNITIQTIGSAAGGNSDLYSGNSSSAGGNYLGGYSSLSTATTGITIGYYSQTNYQEKWPDVEGSVGLIFIKNDKVMIRLDDGEQKEIADLSGPELEIIASLIAIAAKKKLQRT